MSLQTSSTSTLAQKKPALEHDHTENQLSIERGIENQVHKDCPLWHGDVRKDSSGLPVMGLHGRLRRDVTRNAYEDSVQQNKARSHT